MQRSLRRNILAPLLAFAWAAVGCSGLGLPSAAEEAVLGRELSARLEREIGVYADPALRAWIGELGGRLVSASSDPEASWRFGIADVPEPNVITLPDRYVYVSRGLLVLLNSEVELVALLAHGMGHAVSRQWAHQTWPGDDGLAALGQQALLPAEERSPGGASPFAALSGAGLIARFDALHEQQADTVAQQLLAGAGYDPMVLPRVLQALEGSEVWRTQGAGRPDLLESHPVSSARIRLAELRARKQPAHARREIAPRREFLARLEGLTVGRDPTRGVLEGDRFLHGPLGFVVPFPAGWISEGLRQGAAASAPRRDAYAVLEIQPAVGRPVEAARRFADRSGVLLGEGVDLEIGGWPAYRAWAELRTPSGKLALDLTWIAHSDAILQLVGLAPQSRSRVYADSLRALARGVRPLTRGERRSLREKRIQLVSARAGEELAGLCRRASCAWTPDEVAVANGLPREVKLEGDEPVKVAVSRRLVTKP